MSTNQANLSARIGRWSATHRRAAILGWLAFVVVAFVGGGAIGTNYLELEESGVGESGRADLAVYEAFPRLTDEGVLLSSSTMRARDPGFVAAVEDVVAEVESVPGVEEVQGPYDGGGRESISADRHSALVSFRLPETEEGSEAAVESAIAAVDRAAAGQPGLRIEQFGEATSEEQLMQSINDDLKKAEFISLPLTLTILLIAFGGLAVAGVPVLLALSAVFATFGLIGPLSQLFPVSDAVNSIVLLIGLAVGVDYALFYVRRVREERAAGRDHQAAIEAAAATSGRAVLVSGFTVVAAMGGMYLAGAADFTSLATGTIIVVLLAMVGSLTVLPAILSKMERRIDGGRWKISAAIRARASKIQIWPRITGVVLRRPAVSAALATALLVAMAIPALGMKTADAGPESLPQQLEVVQTYNRVTEAFPSEMSAAEVVVSAANARSAEVVGGIEALTKRIGSDSELFPGSPEVDFSPDDSVARVTVPTVGDGIDGESQSALDALRGEIVPATIGAVDGVTADVTGTAAQTRDFNESMVSHLPLVVGFVLVAAFALLLVTFRSVVIPLKAIVLNLLSVGAAYGVMVLVFQGEWAEGLLGFNSSGTIMPWLPLFLFVILFGLSMDYHVFILSRIREAYDRGMTTEDAVAHGISATAGVVTSAAFVMVAVFSTFATLSLLDFKQMGVGLAVAIFIDATLIRGVLLPAAMVLLGDRNWWMPRSLDWIPKLSPESEVAVAES